jgi:hypothetical protein
MKFYFIFKIQGLVEKQRGFIKKQKFSQLEIKVLPKNKKVFL